jgi:hypothetical protein
MKLVCAFLTLLWPGHLALAQSPANGQPPAAEAISTPALLERVAVLGASVSGGYGLAAELEAEVDVGTILECALRAKPESCLVAARQYFFMDPGKHGRQLLDLVEESRPTLVVALDYLFWFPFGPEPSEAARLAELETGLKLLGELECPLVVGDFPDISQALEGEGPLGGPLVTLELLASPETIEALNARLRAWAKERGNVAVVPMSDFLSRLRREEAVTVRSIQWPAYSMPTVLQKDLLHPTLEGSIALTLLALDALVATRDDVPDEAIEWDVHAVRECLLERTRAERERRRELDRLREERKKKAREKREGDDGDGGVTVLERASPPGGGLACSNLS